MKIALVNLFYKYPSLNEEGFFRVPYIPLSIAKINAYLRSKGVKPKIIDFNSIPHQDETKLKLFDKFFFHNERIMKYFLSGSKDEDLEKFYLSLIREFKLDKFDIIGFSISSSSQVLPALILANKLKEACDVTIVFGGAFSINYESLPYLCCVDYVIRKEGEEPFYLLVNYLSGSKIQLSEISGLAYKQGKKYIKNDIKPPNINELPIPSFEGFDMGSYYFNPKKFRNPVNYLLSPSFPLNYSENKVLVLPYDFIKGCPYFCFFCGNDDRKIQTKKFDLIVEQLSAMSRKYKTRHFNFLNFIFNISAKYVDSFHEAINDGGLDITWNDSARPNISTLSIDKLRKLSKIGCNGFAFGIESGSQQLLSRMNRKYDIKGVNKILKCSKENEMWVSANFIVGYPYETEKEFNETLKLIRKNFDFIDSFLISKFRLHTSSYIGKNPEKFGLKYAAKFRVGQILGDSHYAFNFDEIGGLLSKDKLEQQDVRLLKTNQLIIDLLGTKQ